MTELYLQSATDLVKKSQWYNPASWLGQSSQNAPLSPAIGPSQVMPTSTTQNIGGTISRNPAAQPYNLAPTTHQNDTKLIRELEKGYSTLLNHINTLSKEMKDNFASWRPLYDAFNQIKPQWQQFRQRAYSDPNFAASVNVQEMQNAVQIINQVLPMIAQMASEQQRNQLSFAQFFQSANQAIQSIGQLVGSYIQTQGPAQVVETAQPVPTAPSRIKGRFVPRPGAEVDEAGLSLNPEAVRSRQRRQRRRDMTSSPVSAATASANRFVRFS